MIVVAVRYQHGVDGRQIGKGDARIVDPLRSDKTEWRGALRPYRVEQDIAAAGLNQEACVADIAIAPDRALDAWRRTVGIRRWRPRRPLRSGGAPQTMPTQ